MQKLQLELKNTPTSTPQACSSVNLELNRVEKLSALDIKLNCNNPNVDLPQHTEGRKVNVYVISINGLPLMPCKPAKARKLLRSKRARVLRRFPFTIQLTFECENQVQPVTLGIDTGFNNIGFSCISEEKELISGTLILDDKTVSRLRERRMYRRGRRNRLWYRKPRFNNRKKKEGWLPPSTERRYQTHLRLIDILKKILPISNVILEIAKFDIQKIENPDIKSIEYQKGDLYEYQNIRSYLLTREKGLCQLCGKEFSKGNPPHVHHLRQRKDQGSNRVKNLALLHEKCHEKLHERNMKLRAPKNYRAPTFMSIINKRFWRDIPGMKVTYGHITFVNRNSLKLEKTHYNDAFVISGGKHQIRSKPLEILQKHRNNRVLQLNRKGFKPSIRIQRYNIQPKDLVWIGDKMLRVIGIQNKGKYVKVEGLKKVLAVKDVKKIFNFGSFVYNNI